MNATELPTNWSTGFAHPFHIGAGGTETPFLKNGQWHLRLWNVVDRKHYVYNFTTDMMEAE